MQSLPSAFKDTTHFVNLIKSKQFDANVVLASIDVSSLYTNIPHREGINACVAALREQANPDPLRPPPEVVGQLISIVLSSNVFTFNVLTLKSKVQPWANSHLHMRIFSCPYFHNKIALWKRFIDDIFVIWTGTTEEFMELMTYANSMRQSSSSTR